MPPLAEVQCRIRQAVVDGEFGGVADWLVGGRDPAARLAVHRRHYQASLVAAILRKFPGVVWLVGEPFAGAAARDFVRAHPPRAPCIAEYGDGFPEFLAGRRGAERMPYLRWFAGLEILLGEASLAVERAPLGLEALARFGPKALPDVTLATQPALAYFEAPWPIDELAKLHLAGGAPDRYALEATSVRLQIRGARGSVRIDRLEPASFAFRAAVAGARTLGEAADAALEIEPGFDPGLGLAALFADGLVIAAGLNSPGARA